MMILEALSRKEASLSLSTVSTCAVALLIGRLLLPGDPSSSSSTSWPVADEIAVVGPLEVPSVDSGRAFARESAAIGQAFTLATVVIPSSRGCAEELRMLWHRGLSLTGGKAAIHEVLQDNALLAVAVAVWVLLGTLVCRADVQDIALQMQDEPADPACVEDLPTSGNGLRRILCRGLCVAPALAQRWCSFVQRPLCRGLCLVAALGLAAAGLTSPPWLRGSCSCSGRCVGRA